MVQSFCFVGDPGSRKLDMLHSIRDAGLDPVRVEASGEAIADLCEERPMAIAIGSDVEDRSGLMAAVRQHRALDPVPLLACLDMQTPREVERAFADGADDYLVVGECEQLTTLVEVLLNADIWNIVRAPAGMVVLAESRREERIRLGHVLRRNGFDIHYASNVTELEEAVTELEPRAVVASLDLPGNSILATMHRAAAVPDSSPWILLDPGLPDRRLSDADVLSSTAVLRIDDDAERLTFLMNELLTPAPPMARRTPRLLYGTPVAYKATVNGKLFHGYSYNVNRGGVFVRSLTPLPRQTLIRMRFRPPFGRGEVAGRAQVMWVRGFAESNGAASPPGMGVQFVDWDVADRAGYEAGYGALLEQHERGLPSPPPERHDQMPITCHPPSMEA